MKWIIIGFLFFINIRSFAQEHELIIRIPKQSESNIIKISRQLNCLEGVHFSGYVKDASCLLLRFNSAFIANKNIITTMIKHLNDKLKYKVIEGFTAYAVIDGQLKDPFLMNVKEKKKAVQINEQP